ncbi:UV DNA damage repair endonuclease UvsE [Alteribacter natronophilus]|uniref:UV DNA damage repair endonuclease UvsE n=1 Tax=Alteribacter natronophilus TaxID=2583810 RepID=UPI00110E1196|nr:UV DNA damage repair endonuclease UvsE [Alteribacter natronophilus]TMW73101.1 UV DNA damage repair endonuclease UvsE [Alteribacter natronophilus]
MIVRFGYVAMSMALSNASPSKTMTAKQFEKLNNREAALRKLERTASLNLENCRRLLIHNKAHDITFFRLSSRLVPLVDHPLTEGWNWHRAIRENLNSLGETVRETESRVDFHPDHFTVLNTDSDDLFKRSLRVLLYHYRLLKGMGVDHTHRTVLHIGGKKYGVEKGLETFVERFQEVPAALGQMLMVENDDTNYTVEHALYLGEKIQVPVVFDLHHHDVHGGKPIGSFWERVVSTWGHSPLPMKMHVSSPRDHENDKSHADYINADRLYAFLKEINGSVPRLDIMIEAKQKDGALFRLMKDLKEKPGISVQNQSTIELER